MKLRHTKTRAQNRVCLGFAALALLTTNLVLVPQVFAATGSVLPGPVYRFGVGGVPQPTRPTPGYARVVFTQDGVEIGGHTVPWGGQVTLTDADALQFFPGDGACRYYYGNQAIINEGNVTSAQITLQNSSDNNPPSGVILNGLAPQAVYRVPYGGQWAFKPGDHVLHFFVSTAAPALVAQVDQRSITIHVTGPCQPRFRPSPGFKPNFP